MCDQALGLSKAECLAPFEQVTERNTSAGPLRLNGQVQEPTIPFCCGCDRTRRRLIKRLERSHLQHDPVSLDGALPGSHHLPVQHHRRAQHSTSGSSLLRICYVFDMESLSLVDGPFTVAHGRGSVGDDDSGMPTWFSNRPGSNATSLGLYLTQETYAFRGTSDGAPYRSVGLRLTGVSGRFNSAARSRGIVVHGAPSVTTEKAGRSEGCPAMEPDRAEWLIPRISNGGLVFLFSPLDSQWIREEARVLDDRSQGTLAGLIG